MQEALSHDHGVVGGRKLLAEEVRRELRQFILPGGIETRRSSYATDLSLRHLQARLELAEQERHFDCLGTGIRMDFVQYQPANVGAVQQGAVAREQEDVLQHRVVGHQDVRWPPEHLLATQKPVCRRVDLPVEITLKPWHGY